MNFLQPIWLYAMAGIIIPIAIHFWNIREGKAYPVGSIVLLEKSIKKYTRTLRINEWLLLILRCLLIILLAMLFAKPVKQQKFSNKKGWILIDKRNTSALYNHFKPMIDSLINTGYELHSFDKDFETTNLKDVLASEDSLNIYASYWQLIKKADNKLPASFPVYVFTSNSQKNFQGEKPTVNAAFKWFTYSADTSIEQIAKAWLINENTIRIMLANSAGSGNVFDYKDIAAKQQSNSGYKITSNNNQLFVSYKNQPPVAVDTNKIHVSIYFDKNRTDANYIKASLDAIAQFTQQNIQTTITNNASSLFQKNDWLFWLSDNAMPVNIAVKNIFKYESGKEKTITSAINTNATTQQTITINKRIVADSALNNSLIILWKDGFGNPLLTKENNNDVVVFHFYSHFNPQWNNLVWSDAFPSLLLHLLFEDKINTINANYTDQRITDAKQIQPVFASNPNKNVASTTEDLSTIFWLIAFLLFCTERILAFRTKTNIAG